MTCLKIGVFELSLKIIKSTLPRILPFLFQHSEALRHFSRASIQPLAVAIFELVVILYDFDSNIFVLIDDGDRY